MQPEQNSNIGQTVASSQPITQTMQSVQPQPTNPSAPLVVDPQPPLISSSQPNQKTIKTASRSNLVLAVFVIIISLISALGAGSASNKTVLLIFTALYVILSTLVLVSALKLKKANELGSQKSALLQITILSFFVVIVAVLSSIVSKKGFIGFFGLLYLINFIYVLVVRSRLKS